MDHASPRHHVEPAGPPAVISLAGLTITKISVGPLDNNAYVLADRATGDRLLIDAAAEPDRLRAALSEGPLVGIVTTHAHPDHWGALEALLTDDTASYAHRYDANAISPVPTSIVEHGDAITFGMTSVAVIHLRGHTPGSIALLHRPASGPAHVFSGDSLFPAGVGRTTSSEDFDSLLGDVRARLFEVLSDDTTVHPGHGDSTTLGDERPELEEWRRRGW